MKKKFKKEKGFVSKTLLFIIIILLISDAIVFENKMVNKIKESIPSMIESVNTFIEKEKNSKDDITNININENFNKEDIRYTKNCEEIVKGMGMGEQLLKESDKETSIRYHQTNGNDLIISIGKDGSCTIKEAE